MTFPASGWFGLAITDAMQATDFSGTKHDYNDATANRFRCHIYDNTFPTAGSFDKNTSTGDYTAAPWTGAAEIGGTYKALTTPAMSISAGVIKWDDSGAEYVQWTGVTLTGARGLFVRDSTINRGICVINFGVSKDVVGGTLTVTWDATYGIAAIVF
jgi:hypothetical protein